MATMSTINRKLENGTYQSIYCHWDGHVSNNGKLLFENYQDPEKINDLFHRARFGGLSSLATTVEDCEFYDDCEESVTVYPTKIDLIKNGQGYEYLWEDHYWHVACADTRAKFVNLENELNQLKEDA